jgi:hypothetical protein
MTLEDASEDMPGRWAFYLEEEQQVIEERIADEEFDPTPLVILNDGTTISLASQSLSFGSFVSEQEFVQNEIS